MGQAIEMPFYLAMDTDSGLLLAASGRSAFHPMQATYLIAPYAAIRVFQTADIEFDIRNTHLLMHRIRAANHQSPI
jgi:hypothetical protein